MGILNKSNKKKLEKALEEAEKETLPEVVKAPRAPSFTWKPDDKITITGMEFQTVFNGFKQLYELKRGYESPISHFDEVLIYQAVMENIDRVFNRAVEEKIIIQS